MGILEQVQSGSNFVRTQTFLSSGVVSGSTTAFNYSYILLGITSQAPCRVRLYSDSSSMVLDANRATSSFALDPAVGLILDTELDSSSLSLEFDPPIIGTTFLNGETWYNIDSITSQTVTITSYPIEFTTTGRSQIAVSGSGLLTGSTGIEGNIYSPKSFIILSGSASQSESRLRLYSKDINLVPNAEKVRAFGVEPATGSALIVDIAFDSASLQYKLVPIIEGYNLKTYSVGENSVGYILQNISTTTAATNVTASLHVYSIED